MKRQRGKFPRGPHWENKMTSTRLWCAKTRVWVGFSVSLALKRGLGHSIKGFSKEKAIWEFQKNLTFKERLSATMSFLRMTYKKSFSYQ